MQKLLEMYETHPDWMMLGLAGIVAASFFLAFIIRYRSKTSTRRKVKRAIKALGGQAVENITLSDAVDSNLNIDFLVYSQGRLLVLNIQDYPGIIFGGENIEKWTQLFKGKSYKFVNPLHYGRLCVQAAKDRFPSLKVHGQIVFSHHGEFPKGIPDGVSRLEDLVENMKKIPGSESDHQKGLIAWQDFVDNLENKSETRIYKMQSA